MNLNYNNSHNEDSFGRVKDLIQSLDINELRQLQLALINTNSKATEESIAESILSIMENPAKNAPVYKLLKSIEARGTVRDTQSGVNNIIGWNFSQNKSKFKNAA